MTRSDQFEIRAVAFDKDGTLVDFHLTWDPVIERLLTEWSPDEITLAGAAQAVGFDLESRSLLETSPVVADSNDAVAACLAPWFGREGDQQLFLHEIEQKFAETIDTTVVGIAGAEVLLLRLRSAGVSVGMATNDSEESARRQVASLGWTDLFASVVGYDSGYGAKPGPGMVTGSANALGVDPSEMAMVGDSRHDVESARAAGATAVYVGTSQTIGNSADVWLSDISDVGDLVLGSGPN